MTLLLFGASQLCELAFAGRGCFWFSESVEGEGFRCWLTLTWTRGGLTFIPHSLITETAVLNAWEPVASTQTVTEGLMGNENHRNCSKEVCASLLPDSLPASIYPIKAAEAMTCLLPSWFHSADPPSLPLEGMMDWFETKPSHSQTERFLFTTGKNLKPLEKIMYQLCINSFTTR